jgi:hypothetical protein
VPTAAAGVDLVTAPGLAHRRRLAALDPGDLAEGHDGRHVKVWPLGSPGIQQRGHVIMLRGELVDRDWQTLVAATDVGARRSRLRE